MLPAEGWGDLKDAPFEVDADDGFLCRPCEDEEIVQDDLGQAHQVPRGLLSPKAPSKDAIRKHNLTHWPYAPWCPWCVMARRNAEPHFQCKDDQGRLLPLLVLDYCFVKGEADAELVTRLVGKLYPFRMTFACVVDANKSGHTPYEELHGRRAKERRAEFGERVFYSTPKKGRAKLDLRWKLGAYLGQSDSSNEAFVGTSNGNVVKTRSIVRVVETARWKRAAVERVVGTPADMKPVVDDEPTADDIEGSENPHEFDPKDVEADAEPPRPPPPPKAESAGPSIS